MVHSDVHSMLYIYYVYGLVNLAFALALHTHREGIDGRKRRPRVGILDLDIFGPSIPKLMGLDNADEPLLTSCSCHGLRLHF